MSTEYLFTKIIHKYTPLLAFLLFNFFALKGCVDKIDNAYCQGRCGSRVF